MARFLVVDDAETVRLRLRDHLRALAPFGECVEAGSPTEGIDRVAAEPFDLVLLDGVFSDGTPSADVMRAMLAARPRARVVLVTARPREHPEVVEALGIGAYAYLRKPVRRDELREVIQRAEQDDANITRIR